MKYRGYTIKAVSGKRIGKGEVKITRGIYEIDVYENLKIAKQKINYHLFKWANN